ncbi:hypothetical protein H4Q26_009980 [Puccinia striiformis f. sp. tritici PST-130]|uniref:Uncharacterized protein n=1 Tax=Puccinia striiformis f. sp. tritici PST-78 TaxID=1165861 RepID=A0A0L0VTY1_9BASI|nr:hypothetical protein Pst134EB_005711 [Puccinia striiformis f. sp. tritici]KAI9613378.1 hypothetical protein H4Q26_009980 [Puccinia striiformis f. sp. tritici PST-130]KNF02667.1 hypothetical protein PSTG_04265 [Puccinia striiformis f. sp. tritici PST-78]
MGSFKQTSDGYEARIRNLEEIVCHLLTSKDRSPFALKDLAPPTGSFKYSMDRGLIPLLSKPTAQLLTFARSNYRTSFSPRLSSHSNLTPKKPLNLNHQSSGTRLDSRPLSTLRPQCQPSKPVSQAFSILSDHHLSSSGNQISSEKPFPAVEPKPNKSLSTSSSSPVLPLSGSSTTVPLTERSNLGSSADLCTAVIVAESHNTPSTLSFIDTTADSTALDSPPLPSFVTSPEQLTSTSAHLATTAIVFESHDQSSTSSIFKGPASDSGTATTSPTQITPKTPEKISVSNGAPTGHDPLSFSASTFKPPQHQRTQLLSTDSSLESSDQTVATTSPVDPITSNPALNHLGHLDRPTSARSAPQSLPIHRADPHESPLVLKKLQRSASSLDRLMELKSRSISSLSEAPDRSTLDSDFNPSSRLPRPDPTDTPSHAPVNAIIVIADDSLPTSSVANPAGISTTVNTSRLTPPYSSTLPTVPTTMTLPLSDASSDVQLAPDFSHATQEYYNDEGNCFTHTNIYEAEKKKKKKKKKKKTTTSGSNPSLPSPPSEVQTAAVGGLSVMDEEELAALERKNDPRYRPIEDSEFIGWDECIDSPTSTTNNPILFYV